MPASPYIAFAILGLRARYVFADSRSCLEALREHRAFVSGLAPVPCRDDLASMAQRHFHKTGHAVEIGVFRGAFAANNLRQWMGHYTAVDAWAYRPTDPGDKNFAGTRINQRNKDMAWAQMLKSVQGDNRRITLIQSLSHDGAKLFNDSHFDWIYVDALHTFEAVLTDLRAWWPKLRAGGLLSGDDYGDIVDTEFVTRQRYVRMLKVPAQADIPYRVENSWGVIRAVQSFARETGSTLHVTWSLDCYPWPAWYMIKSPNCGDPTRPTL